MPRELERLHTCTPGKYDSSTSAAAAVQQSGIIRMHEAVRTAVHKFPGTYFVRMACSNTEHTGTEAAV